MPRVAGAMDRLFVDSGERLRAQGVLDARLPGLRQAFDGGAERVETGHGDAAPAGSGPAGSGASGPGECRPVEQGPQDPADRPVPREATAEPTPQEQEDAAWRAIVAGWADTAPDPVPHWPVEGGPAGSAGSAGPAGPGSAAGADGPAGAGDRDGSRGTGTGTDPGVDPGGRNRRTGRHRDERTEGHRANPGDSERSSGAGDTPRRHPRAPWGRAAPGGPRGRRRGDPPALPGGAEEERYVPPPPPPLPRADAVTVAAWAGLLGGPALVIIVTLAGVGVARSVAVLALVAFVGGFVTLVARMQDRPPTDSGPDDGAVV